MKPMIVSVAGLLLASMSSAFASTGDAWEAHDQEVLEQCLSLSQFENAVPAGEPVLFDDEVGMTALLLTGTYPQAYMNGQTGQELCLFDRSAQKAYIADADTLTEGVPDSDTE